MSDYQIKIIEARGLRPLDFNGKSDPYAKASFHEVEYKTKVQRETLEPNWDTEFVVREVEGGDSLHVEVYDFDIVNSDERIGAVTVDLDGVKDLDSWHELKADSGEPAGELHLKITRLQ